MKKTIIIVLAIFLLFATTDQISADLSVAGSSAQLAYPDSYQDNFDSRVIVLRQFLQEQNSPLSQYSDIFIKYADDNELDWRLIPAITGVESTFGKNIPANSYNAYGWANGNYSFSSWEESISTVSITLNEKYIAKGATTIEKIGKIYAPPSTTWAYKVKYFMNKIQAFPLEYTI